LNFFENNDESDRIPKDSIEHYLRFMRVFSFVVISVEAKEKTLYDKIDPEKRDSLIDERLPQYMSLITSGMDDDVFDKYLRINEIEMFAKETLEEEGDDYIINPRLLGKIINFCRNRIYNEEAANKVKKGEKDLYWDGDDFVIKDKN
jgi:hypothetical protein